MAAQLAAQLHALDRRNKNGRPYVTHLIRVAGRVATLEGATEDMVAAAFLHDHPEDHAKTHEEADAMLQELEKTLGEPVAKLVHELTNASKLWMYSPRPPRAERKRHDREKLAMASREAKIIKLVDRIDNLNETISDMEGGYDTDAKFAKLYAHESLQLLEDSLVMTHNELEAELRDVITRVHKVADALMLERMARPVRR